jgi:hypothetical protein
MARLLSFRDTVPEDRRKLYDRWVDTVAGHANMQYEESEYVRRVMRKAVAHGVRLLNPDPVVKAFLAHDLNDGDAGDAAQGLSSDLRFWMLSSSSGYEAP